MIESMIDASIFRHPITGVDTFNEMKCLNDTSATLENQFGRSNYKSFDVSFVPCAVVKPNPEVQCVTEDRVERMVSKQKM